MTNVLDPDLPPARVGLLLHEARYYDLIVWLMTLGRERAFREKIVRLAHLEPGEAVLDVGCGTGSLAIAAKRHVGDSGTVYGIDASPEMLARADKKARKSGANVIFKQAAAQSLPFPDGHFDAVLSTVMFHHLSRKAREQCVQEAGRVLKPGGRVLIVDFASRTRGQRGVFRHIHRHGHVRLEDIEAILTEAGLDIVESGAVGYRDLHFALATAAK